MTPEVKHERRVIVFMMSYSGGSILPPALPLPGKIVRGDSTTSGRMIGNGIREVAE